MRPSRNRELRFYLFTAAADPLRFQSSMQATRVSIGSHTSTVGETHTGEVSPFAVVVRRCWAETQVLVLVVTVQESRVACPRHAPSMSQRRVIGVGRSELYA